MAGLPQNNVNLPVSVATEAELSGYPTAGEFAFGAVYCAATDQSYRYFPLSAAPIAPGTVIAAAGGGRWIAFGGSGGGSAAFSFASVRQASASRMLDMTAGQVSTLRNGSRAWVQTLRCFFTWDAASTVVDDTSQNLIVNPTANGANPGRFVRDVADPDILWMMQAAWNVNGLTGDNENSGAPGSPLLTPNELGRRWSNSLAENRLGFTPQYTVTFETSTPQANVDDFDLVLPQFSFLVFTGPETALIGPVALTAVTALNRGTQTPWDITAPGLGAAHVGKVVRITSGARAGACARIVKDLGGGKVRISQFATLTNLFASTPVTPQVNDPVAVFSHVVINLGNWRFKFGSNDTPNFPVSNFVQFDKIDLQGVGTLDAAGNCPIVYTQCVAASMQYVGTGDHVLSMGSSSEFGIIQTVNFFGMPIANVGGRLSVFGGGGGGVFLDNDSIFQGIVAGNNSTLNVFQGSPGVFLSTAAFFDNPGSGIFVDAKANVLQTTGNLGLDLAWGNAQTGVGIIVKSDGGYFYTTKPTVTGAGGDTTVGGTAKAYAAIPYVETVNNAEIVVYQ